MACYNPRIPVIMLDFSALVGFKIKAHKSKCPNTDRGLLAVNDLFYNRAAGVGLTD